jgi:uncharacterized protein (TIGR02597 family)
MKPLYLLLAFATFVALADAQTVSTDPVGFIPIVAKGNSDTYLSLPLHRGLAFQGTLASVNESTLAVNSAAFQTNGYKDTHFVLIASGSKEGRWYAITGNAPTTVTVELAGDTLGAAVTTGTEIQIIPFWTLNTLFPEGAGVKPSPTFLAQSTVLIPDQVRAGTNLAASDAFFYFSGNSFGGEGWRKFGAPPNELFDGFALLPDSALIVRHESPGDTTITIPGAVQMTSLTNLFGTLETNKPQDTSLAFNVAVPTSLADSRLFQSGGFTGSNVIDVPVDQLLVFDNSVAQQNKPPAAIYYYYLGTSNGLPGWRLKGDLNTVQDAALVFQPGNGYILRKAAASQPGTAFWTVRPFYVPQ